MIIIILKRQVIALRKKKKPGLISWFLFLYWEASSSKSLRRSEDICRRNFMEIWSTWKWVIPPLKFTYPVDHPGWRILLECPHYLVLLFLKWSDTHHLTRLWPLWWRPCGRRRVRRLPRRDPSLQLGHFRDHPRVGHHHLGGRNRGSFSCPLSNLALSPSCFSFPLFLLFPCKVPSLVFVNRYIVITKEKNPSIFTVRKSRNFIFGMRYLVSSQTITSCSCR